MACEFRQQSSNPATEYVPERLARAVRRPCQKFDASHFKSAAPRQQHHLRRERLEDKPINDRPMQRRSRSLSTRSHNRSRSVTLDRRDQQAARCRKHRNAETVSVCTASTARRTLPQARARFRFANVKLREARPRSWRCPLRAARRHACATRCSDRHALSGGLDPITLKCCSSAPPRATPGRRAWCAGAGRDTCPARRSSEEWAP